MKLKTLTSIGLAAVFSLALAMPVLAQGNEAKDYQASQDERDQKKQRTLLEAFLTNYPKSTHRADVETQLMPLYIGGKDLNQAIKTADAFGPAEEAADPKVKAKFFTFAMEAARQQGASSTPNSNLAKMTGYAEKALAADPQNLSVLMTMSRTLLENLPKDDAPMKAGLDKALSYAQRAQKVTKPETMDDPAWTDNRVRLHDTLALIYAGQGHLPEAAAELKEIIKVKPTDVQAEYRYGMASFSQLQDMVVNLQALNQEAKDVEAKGGDVSTYADLLTKHKKEFEDQRDITIDTMAKVMALGGASAPEQARKVLETAYKQKNNNSLEGLDTLIAAKKAEMVALTPLAPPQVVPTRSSGPPAGGTGAAGGRSGSR